MFEEPERPRSPIRIDWDALIHNPTEEGAHPQFPRPVHPNDVREPAVLAHELALKFFPDSYPHPFAISENDDSRTPDEWGDAPRCIVELRMCALSAAIRDKTDWQLKMKNPDIVEKWRNEALGQALPDDDLPEWKLSEKMVDYVLQELEDYAGLRDAETGIEMACYERVWKSDSLVPLELSMKLLAGVKVLEDVPDDQKDWHPGSNGQVLDLVHPSLYCVSYLNTWERLADNTFAVMEPPMESGASNFLSADFAWLPSDFVISDDGVAVLSPGTYINNLHPDHHAALYPVIASLVTLAVPMFERVLSDLKRPLTKQRMVTEPKWSFRDMRPEQVHGIPCIWQKGGKSTGPPEPRMYGIDWKGWESRDFEEWAKTIPKVLPEALDKYDGALGVVKQTVSLRGSTIQIIVKLANIVLTPEKLSYPGGSWHVEGMLNEEIVSTFIYYYDEDNITESRLAFRTSILEPLYDGQDDDECTNIIYGVRRDTPLVQDLGSVRTCNGRCIAFPNIYQHKVQPFSLADRTRPGHRKILALFLVNPDKHVPSTTTVPPQQYEWIAEACRGPLSEHLPVELVDTICEHLLAFTCTREVAESQRASLMKERSQFVKEHTESKYQVGFNMCEH
ncbi:hypothetical protein BDZ89DRAFT_1015748, partial [Hymenopellis radicata]